VKVALVHDWLNGLRGGERVLEQLCLLYPDADVFTLVHLPGSAGEIIGRHRITASFLDRLPRRGYRHYLPLYPSPSRASISRPTTWSSPPAMP